MNDKSIYPTWKDKDGNWHNDRLPTVDDCMTLPNDKSKLDIEEEIKSVLSPNSYIDPSEGIALCKHLNDVIEAEVEKAVKQAKIDTLIQLKMALSEYQLHTPVNEQMLIQQWIEQFIAKSLILILPLKEKL